MSTVAPVSLPPVELRQGGDHFLSDSDFLTSAIADAERLRSYGLEEDSRVLDFGCGPGRLAIGLIAAGWFRGSYLGVEVQQRHVDWCTANITVQWPNYRFVLSSSRNERYNPEGASSSHVPAEDRSVDFFYAYSVFSHMTGSDVAAYMSEIRRVLAQNGRAFVTLFTESGGPEETENPDWYGPLEWRGRLHCVLYSIDRVMEMVGLAGLLPVGFFKGTETDGQTGLVLKAARTLNEDGARSMVEAAPSMAGGSPTRSPER